MPKMLKRRSHRSFTRMAFLVWAIHLIIGVTLTWLVNNSVAGQDFQAAVNLNIINMAVGVVFLLVYIFLSAQRLQDMNITGWAALVWLPVALLAGNTFVIAALIPLIVLAAIPGNTGKNSYGPATVKK